MQAYKDLTIIGTSHISRDSIQQIRLFISQHKPGIVAVELDQARLTSLFAKKRPTPSIRDIRRMGVKGFLFALIGGWFSRKLGKLVGVEPGSEIKEAIVEGRKAQARIALIDQPIEITLRKFSRSFSWREKWCLLVDLFKGFFGKKDPLMQFDISKVPEKKVIRLLLQRLKQRYPSLHRVIIDERNYYMARKIKALLSENPAVHILAVVGAGHEDEIIRILKDNEFRA